MYQPHLPPLVLQLRLVQPPLVPQLPPLQPALALVHNPVQEVNKQQGVETPLPVLSFLEWVVLSAVLSVLSVLSLARWLSYDSFHRY